MINHQNSLKQRLAAGETAIGLWITLEAPTITEIAVTLGFDWVGIDAEHGHLGFREIQEHIRVCRNTACTPLVRIQEVQQGLIKRVLDIGAEGILVPQVYGPEEVARAVRFAKYPPWGIRGVGGERATSWNLDLAGYTAAANRETLVIPLMETTAAGEGIESILDVPGVDAIYFGPADYSSSAGYLGQWEAPEVVDRLQAIKARILARGVPCGISAGDPEAARKRREQGFRMICVGSDTGLLIKGAQAGMGALRG
jgi:2-keto-3-deoxy-L-rhamnonate aldolase RhmA